MISFVKSLHLSRILIVFFAGIMLLINTACSQPSSDQISSEQMYKTNKTGYDTKNNVVLKAVKDSYQTVPPEGGMNNHRDTDRRQNIKATEAKGKELVDQAKSHLQASSLNTKEAAENLTNNDSMNKVKDKFEDFSKNVTDSTEEIKKGANKNFENLKTNLQSASDKVSDNVRQATK